MKKFNKLERRFIDCSGNCCPGCGSKEIATGTGNRKMSAAGLMIKMRMACFDCRKLWEMHFTFDCLEEVPDA